MEAFVEDPHFSHEGVVFDVLAVCLKLSNVFHCSTSLGEVLHRPHAVSRWIGVSEQVAEGLHEHCK